ncbi:MAG TPA: TSUP family transporter, partial [Deltaproteobacteria bacterium]|nr:TSUP family transporter [Deltaproteobacteria bacterium]
MAQGPGIALLIIIGLGSGIMSGMFGIGGGIIIVPALVYLMGFSQHEAIGTSLAILLPPVGLGAVL